MIRQKLQSRGTRLVLVLLCGVAAFAGFYMLVSAGAGEKQVGALAQYEPGTTLPGPPESGPGRNIGEAKSNACKKAKQKLKKAKAKLKKAETTAQKENAEKKVKKAKKAKKNACF
jgi:hypothetical protein